MKKPEINLFFSCDENYIPFFAVTLQSIKNHASNDNFYSIKVLHGNTIKFTTQESITKLFESQNFEIQFVDISQQIKPFFSNLHTRDYYSKSTYYRLFIPNLYQEMDKALYLDSDIVVLDDVANLYNVDLKDNYVAGVHDQAVEIIPEFQEYVVNRIGVKKQEDYFNAGILLMNLEKLRKINFQEKFIELLNRVTYVVAQDQDYLNTICKGHVLLLDKSWNTMPIPNTEVPENQLKIVHYNLSFKPWHTSVLYEKFFWEYAKQTPYYEQIYEIRQNYDANLQTKSTNETTNLVALAKKQADDKAENVRILAIVDDISNGNYHATQPVKKSQERLDILAKIKEYEKNGWFDKDVENDPPSKELLPDQIDYLREKISSKIKTAFTYALARKAMNKLIKDRVLIVDNVIGSKNWNKIEGGAIITCNHFSPMDSFAMQIAYEKSRQKGKKMYKVIKEGNYTNFPGLYGKIFKNCYTLPLSSNRKTMEKFLHSVEKILQHGDYILVYPEQSMWWNYKKPKPLKPGAYKFAVKNNVPIVPVFITMQDSDIIGQDGFYNQELTIHILEPLYANSELTQSEQVQDLMARNFALWKDCYEKTYNKKLKYITE